MPRKAKKIPYAQQRRIWINQGLCAIDGKAKIWKGHSTCECRAHFLYYRAKAKEYAASNATATPAPRATKRSLPVPVTNAQLVNNLAQAVAAKAVKIVAAAPRTKTAAAGKA
jgi:hypothetical protein